MASPHISDSDLELLALDQLPASVAARAEEHLLACAGAFNMAQFACGGNLWPVASVLASSQTPARPAAGLTPPGFGNHPRQAFTFSAIRFDVYGFWMNPDTCWPVNKVIASDSP